MELTRKLLNALPVRYLPKWNGWKAFLAGQLRQAILTELTGQQARSGLMFELFFVLSKALEFAELSGGALTPQLPPLRTLGFGTAHPRVPSGEELQKVLPLIDYRLAELDEDRSAVFLPLKDEA